MNPRALSPHIGASDSDRLWTGGSFLTDTIVIFLLATLPMTGVSGSQLDRDAIAARAGCGVAGITIAPEQDGEGWIVIVRCLRVPIADILRSDPLDDRRKAPCIPSPFAGWCQQKGAP